MNILVAFELMWRATLEAVLKATSTFELRVATKPKTKDLSRPDCEAHLKATTGAMTSDEVIIVKSDSDVAGV